MGLDILLKEMKRLCLRQKERDRSLLFHFISSYTILIGASSCAYYIIRYDASCAYEVRWVWLKTNRGQSGGVTCYPNFTAYNPRPQTSTYAPMVSPVNCTTAQTTIMSASNVVRKVYSYLNLCIAFVVMMYNMFILA